MKVADAHCDTILKYDKNPFNSKEAHWNLDKFKSVNGVLQYMAVCVLPPFHGDSALRLATNTYGGFWKNKTDEINHLGSRDDFDPDKVNVILAMEGATPIIDDIKNLYAFHRMGVRAITLTWNHRNFVGDGLDTQYGLTEFGKDFVKEMEKLKMIVDISHLNERGFEDVVKISERPFAATHSNSRKINDHPRNLSDDQIKEIISRNGFIGINFYSPFIADSKDESILINTFTMHFEHMLKLGAENVLGLGADFDGIDKSPFADVRSYTRVEELLRNKIGLSEEKIEKIMYKNLVDFTLRMI